MNVAILNLKYITKNLVKIIFIILIIILLTRFFIYLNINIYLGKIANNLSFERCSKVYTSLIYNTENKNNKKKDIQILNIGLSMFGKENNLEDINIEPPAKIEKNTEKDILIGEVKSIEPVKEKNLEETFTGEYGTVRIRNQSDYDITYDMLIPNVEITNKKKILIYHTHTCESYTPTEKYNYTMTGNYRTTDSKYNVIRVGTELTTFLTNEGFEVIHDGTYHDYPSYNGSYSRSLETISDLLANNADAQIVIDLHRDAVGNGDTYGPTVMVNGQKVAQLMFVIGTDGGGLEHPNWIQNLKMAVKIQEIANEMYPGLFRPIILRNSRYNQHVTTGASIIEVGATANTLEECLLSMQCLASVFEKVCK